MRKGTERDVDRQTCWQEIVRRQTESGQSVRGYCRRAGVKESAFYWWRRELARRSQQGENLRQPRRGVARRATERSATRESVGMAAGFLPLHVVTDRRPADGCGVEILLGNCRVLRIRPGFDRQTLLDVLGVLEGQGC